MVCKTLFDIKSVAYQTADYADYMSAIGSTFKEILVMKDGITLDTKAENAEFTELNGTRYTDGERIPIRSIGTLKFTKNFDSSLLVNHSDLIEAGLGDLIGGAATSVTVTAGKGSVGTPFLTTTTTGLTDGNLVHIPGEGYRRVLSVVTNTSFVVDVPLNTTISGSTVFSVVKAVDITNPIGNCSKTFNFVLSLHDGSFIELLGCGITCEFAPVYEKQLTINFTITSPDITTVEVTPISSLTAETKGSPVICNFSESVITDDDSEMYSYFPVNFELGLTVTSEPMKAIGGRNNMLGYMSRSSIKPKITLDRIAKCKTWITNSRTPRVYSFYSTSFGIYIAQAKLTLIEQSMNNNNHDSIQCEMDANYDKSYRVYLVLP